MARLHSRKKGKAQSNRPPLLLKPDWVELSKEEVEKLVIDMARKGVPQSKIGAILRDSYGIPLVKQVTGKKISKILEEAVIKSELPEDLYNLIRKAERIKKHLEKNKKDMVSKRGFLNTISKIHRLSKYYKRVGKLPKDWRFKLE